MSIKLRVAVRVRPKLTWEQDRVANRLKAFPGKQEIK